MLLLLQQHHGATGDPGPQRSTGSAELCLAEAVEQIKQLRTDHARRVKPTEVRRSSTLPVHNPVRPAMQH